MKLKLVLTTIIGVMLLIVVASCRGSAKFNLSSFVQVKLQSLATGQSEFASSGIVVQDGMHVLTVIDYENYSPESVTVTTGQNKTYQASIEGVDPRSGLTMLKIQGATGLAAAKIDGPPTQDQAVLYWEFDNGGRITSHSSRVDVRQLSLPVDDNYNCRSCLTENLTSLTFA